MTENAQWVPQEIVKPPQNPPTPGVNQGPVPPAIPNANSNNKLPWFLWLFAGCGCLGFVIIPILVVIVIVALNPAARIKQAEENARKTASQSAQTNSTDQANWKTYTNNDLGFSLSYPSDVSLGHVAYMSDAGGENILGIKGPNYNDASDFGSGMAIWVKQVEGSSLQDAAAKDQESIKSNWNYLNKNITCSTSQTTINNLQVLKQDCGVPGDRFYIQNPNSKKLIRLTTASIPTESYQEKINKIISTFKFL